MKILTKRILSLLLALALLLSVSLPVFSAEGRDYLVYSDSYNSGKRDDVCLTLLGTGAADYYTEGIYDSDTLAELSSEDLLNSLRSLMRDTHKTVTTYANCRDYAPKTDCQNADGTSVVLIYTSFVASMKLYTNNTSGGWNREHVWPQSLGGGNTSGGGADLHHVRPSDSSVNSSRGNKPYGNVISSSTSMGNPTTGGLVGGTYDSVYFEPNDNVKGDIARICLYVYVRWGSDWGADSILEVFRDVDTLLEWCEIDPVDTWEMGRNEVVEAIQGNRNVFIDYPEYAWLLFDREIPYDMTTPSGLAEKIGVKPCDHENTELRGVVDPSCESDGYSGDLYCIDCGYRLQTGNATHPTGHSFGEWIDTPEGYERECVHCGVKEYIYIDSIFDRIDSDAEKILLMMMLGLSEELFLDSVYE